MTTLLGRHLADGPLDTDLSVAGLPLARFEIRCGNCGYGGVVSRLPRRCPMCGESCWQRRPARVLVRQR